MGSIYIILSMLLWSSMGIVIRGTGIGVLHLIFFPSIVAVAFQAAILGARGHFGLIPKGKKLAWIMLLGPILLANNFAFYFAYQNTTIANTILTHYIAPVLVAFLAFMFLGEPLTKRLIAALGASTLGLWILIGIGPAEVIQCIKSPTRDALGVLSGLVSGGIYSVMVIVVRVFAQSYNPVVLAFVQNAVVVIMLGPFITEIPEGEAWRFLLIGVVHSTIAPILYFKGLETVKANRAAILGYSEPIGAILLGMVFLSEYPTQWAYLGGAMILVSGYVAITERN